MRKTGEIDDIVFKKIQMLSGWWGLSRDKISLLYLRHNHFSCWIFFCLIPPSNTTMHCKKLKCNMVYSSNLLELQEDWFVSGKGLKWIWCILHWNHFAIFSNFEHNSLRKNYVGVYICLTFSLQIFKLSYRFYLFSCKILLICLFKFIYIKHFFKSVKLINILFQNLLLWWKYYEFSNF